MNKRAAIILAGGRGERFQSFPDIWQDKALVELYEKPLLIHAIQNVQSAVEEIAVCVNDENRKERYAEILKNYGIANVKLLVDQKNGCLGGPLVAIDTGLRKVYADYCLILPGDMPLMKPEVVEYMFQKARNAHVVVPMWPNGRLETLSMVLERKIALPIADTLCQLQRPRSDDIIRGALDVWFLSTVSEISTLDPELKSFVNINAPQDLSKLQPRRVQGPAMESMHLKTGTLHLQELTLLQEAANLFRERIFTKASEIFSSCATKMEKENSFFWAAISRENQAKSSLSQTKAQSEKLSAKTPPESKEAFLKAASNYELEAKMHEKSLCLFLAERAMSDKAWCESRATTND
jgi:molybdenum cofactor guanylyltransferase